MEQTNGQRTPSEVLQEKGRSIARRGSWMRLLASALVTVICTLILFGLLLGLALVQGDSMNPAFRSSDAVLFNRLPSYGSRGYQAGDVVILQADAEGLRKFLKRVAGVPGDILSIDGAGNVSVNGQILDEPYADGFTEPGSGVVFPLTLGEDEYFVLGDNRENSSDSRIFGPVKAEHIDGKVLTVLRIRA